MSMNSGPNGRPVPRARDFSAPSATSKSYRERGCCTHPTGVGPCRRSNLGSTLRRWRRGETSSLEGKKPEVILEKTKDSIAAYDLLSKKSRVVRELKEGKYLQYKFVEWRAVKNSAPVFWIDLLASDPSGGPQLHLVWSVDLETGDLSALSQAARDLESEAGSNVST